MQMVSTLGLHFMLSFILSLIFPSKLEAHIKYVAEGNSCQCSALDFLVIDNVRKLELWMDTVGSHFWVCKSAHLSSQGFWFSVKSFILQWLAAFLKINTLHIVLYSGEYDQPSHKEMLRLRAHCPQLTDFEIEKCDSIFAWRYCKGGVCGAWLEVFKFILQIYGITEILTLCVPFEQIPSHIFKRIYGNTRTCWVEQEGAHQRHWNCFINVLPICGDSRSGL